MEWLHRWWLRNPIEAMSSDWVRIENALHFGEILKECIKMSPASFPATDKQCIAITAEPFPCINVNLKDFRFYYSTTFISVNFINLVDWYSMSRSCTASISNILYSVRIGIVLLSVYCTRVLVYLWTSTQIFWSFPKICGPFLPCDSP